MAFNCQSAVLLLSTMDHVQAQAFLVGEALESAAKGAVRSRGFRNTFNILDKPSQELVGDVNHHFQGFLYPGTEPVKADLTGLLDGVPEEIRDRILLAVEEAHGDNLERAKLLDRKVRTLANAASSLANTTAEALGTYARVQSALDARQLQILRRHTGNFVHPQAPKLKPGAKPVPTATQASASQGRKKSRSRGSGRSSQGLAAHPTPPPPPPSPAAAPRRSSPAPPPPPPPAPEVRWPAQDIRNKPGYKPWDASNGSGKVEGDLRQRLERRAQEGSSRPPTGKDRREGQRTSSSSSSSTPGPKHHHKGSG